VAVPAKEIVGVTPLGKGVLKATVTFPPSKIEEASKAKSIFLILGSSEPQLVSVKMFIKKKNDDRKYFFIINKGETTRDNIKNPPDIDREDFFKFCI
jgi:hypothetical protein